MADLSNFNPNSVSNPNNNIFGLPFTEDDAAIVLLPIPWDVTVSYNAGTARSSEHIVQAALQVDLFDPEGKDDWKNGFFIKPIDKKILMKSDYLRKEAELYIDYISKGGSLGENKFMCKSLKDINEGSIFLNNWVYEQTKNIITKNKFVVLIGGDHSTSFGYIKALAEHHKDFGILQIDAHCDLRKSYENFTYSHASIMYNVLNEIPEVSKLVQVGVRDYCEEEIEFIEQNENKIATFFDKNIKEEMYEGTTWKMISDKIITSLPQKVYLSFDIDGLDPKLCPNTGTPVPGGFEVEQILYLFRKVKEAGKEIIGFDLVETGVSEQDWDSNVAARILFRMCNMIVKKD
jgi:agmatinase